MHGRQAPFSASDEACTKKARVGDLCVDTWLAGSSRGTTEHFGAISMPIYQTATFSQPEAAVFGKYDYSRSGNPTRDCLQDKLSALEGIESAQSFVFSSGMAAITALCGLISAGEEIIVNDDSYGGTYRLVSNVFARQGIIVSYVDMSGSEGSSRLSQALTSKTKLVLFESPTNPMMRICDIRALAQACRTRESTQQRVLLAVDNTMLSLVLCRPLQLGADVVIHSATKYICGHSDTMAGVLTVAPLTMPSGKTLAEEIYFLQNSTGSALAPFDCWLVLRGMKTMALRVRAQQDSATRIAEWLTTQPLVTRVLYQGLSEHPDHSLHMAQSDGSGGVVCFLTGNVALSEHLVSALRLFSITVSFGSVSSLASLPNLMSHASISAEVKATRHFPVDLVRLCIVSKQSICVCCWGCAVLAAELWVPLLNAFSATCVLLGIEDVEDLLADLQRAFATFPTSVEVEGQHDCGSAPSPGAPS